MSKQLSELCALLVEDIYGKLPATVYSALATLGRASISTLSRTLQLPSTYVRHGLAILIQHRLVLFSVSENGATFYEVDITAAYSIVRRGKYVQLIEERIGIPAAEVFAALQASGFDSIGELFVKTSLPTNNIHSGPSRKNVKTNGEINVDTTEKSDNALVNGNKSLTSELYSAVEDILEAQYAIQLRQEDFLPSNDFDEEMTRRQLEVTVGELKGTKKKEEFRIQVLKRKRDYRDNNQALGQYRSHTRELRAHATNGDMSHSGLHETTKSGKNKRISKKRKLENGTGVATINSVDFNDADSESTALLPAESPLFREPILIINQNKLNLSLRSERFADLATRSLGEPTARVYAALLRRLECRVSACHDEYEEGRDSDDDEDYEPQWHAITTDEIARECDGNIEFETKSLRRTTEGDIEKRKSKEKVNGTSHKDDEYVSGLARFTLQQSLVEQHLELLEADPHHYVYRVSHGTPSRWRVDFAAVARSLIQFEIENVVNARFGSTAVRIIRILHEKGKLDEKQLSITGLIKQKDLRGILTSLQEVGFLEAQEVPRDNSRQPSRTIYLWFYDQDRVRKFLLNDTYKAMTRLLQRVKVEGEKVQTVRSKAERTDVKGREETLLTPTELEALRHWHKVEDKLLVQLHRQDDFVALLRDFLGA